MSLARKSVATSRRSSSGLVSVVNRTLPVARRLPSAGALRSASESSTSESPRNRACPSMLEYRTPSAGTEPLPPRMSRNPARRGASQVPSTRTSALSTPDIRRTRVVKASKVPRSRLSARARIASGPSTCRRGTAASARSSGSATSMPRMRCPVFQIERLPSSSRSS